MQRCAVALLLLLALVGDAQGEASGFPFAWSPETDLPLYARFRAEGLPKWQVGIAFPLYLQKVRRNKHSAPVEELRYFEAQRELLRELASSERGADVGEPAAGIRFGMVGDMMWVRDGWGEVLDPELRRHLAGFDVLVGNLETVVSPRFGVPTLVPAPRRFNSPPSLLRGLSAGPGRSLFSALSVANNHTTDFGEPGIRDTIAALDAEGIRWSGVSEAPASPAYAVIDRAGVRVGFLALTYGVNEPEPSSLAPNLLPSPSEVSSDGLAPIRAALAGMARDGVDLRVVSVHWGHEFEYYPTPETMQLARELVRAGADVVMGHHPHVEQPFEVCFVDGYASRLAAQGVRASALAADRGCVLEDGAGRPRKALVAYSLGNFLTQIPATASRVGMLAALRVSRGPDGRVEWRGPEVTLLYNVPAHPRTGARSVVLLDRFAAEGCGGEGCPDDLEPVAAFLRRHLVGVRAPQARTVAVH